MCQKSEKKEKKVQNVNTPKKTVLKKLLHTLPKKKKRIVNVVTPDPPQRKKHNKILYGGKCQSCIRSILQPVSIS